MLFVIMFISLHKEPSLQVITSVFPQEEAEAEI